MDLNYLFQRHQVSLIMAERAETAQSRRIHLELAERYGARIASARLFSSDLSAA